ncbi:unnamed protein product [Phytophthora fragariaefolia]|uniref:Unnamed protein product n=1 Tax=Phytophthora fragariaefolia TaxID=1490495 RepID=A0A9W6X835_9STRA|nr:unnamed protein product [Phytophthora fragariaefolia]
MALLQQRAVVQSAQKVAKVLTAEQREKGNQLPATAKGKTAGSPNGGAMSFRVLMMAGMLSCHPREIMGQDASNRLEYAAKAVLAEMGKLSQCLTASRGFQLLTKCVAKLSARFAFYVEAFDRWKARDAERLAKELLVSYAELLVVQSRYEVQAREAQSVDGVHELLRQTQRQLLQLQGALERLLGREAARLKVQQLEQSFKQGQEAGENAVRVGDSDSSTGGDDHSSSGNDDTTSSSSPPMDTGDEGDDKREDDDEMQGGDEEDSKDVHPSVNQALLADRKLVHELILNPQFQIPREKDAEASAAAVASQNSVAAMAVRVREAMTKAFWDRVVEANDVETLLARTEELRTTFRDALGGGSGAGIGSGLSALADQVDGALRPDQLRELMQDPARNVHVIHARCNGVLDAIERAEAPARAETTRRFRSDWAQRIAAGVMSPVQLLVAFLAFALDKVDELRSDVLNAHLGLLGTYLQRHGVEYEQRQLQARLAESGSVNAGFPMTVKWLSLEMEAYVARSEVDEAERSQLARHAGAAFDRFVLASIWSLVEKHIDGTSTRAWPEIFELDIARVRACRDELDRIAVVSSLLALVQEYVARHNLSVAPDFFQTVAQQLSTLLRSPGVSGAQLAAQAAQDVRQLQSSGSEDVKQELEALEKRLLGSFAADNPVFKLFFSRTARAFEAAVLSKSSNQVELHPSLAPFAADITEATSVLRRLAKHNESVYASLYNSIIKTLVPAL